MGFTKNIIRVFSANLLSLLSGIMLGFITPAVLSIESYSNLKTYTFYISYITVLHLGFVDGIYIKYGGKKYDEIDLGSLKYEHNFLVKIQLIITFCILIISFFYKDVILFIFALSVIPINVSSFHKQFNQSIGQFKEFAKASNNYTIIVLLMNIILLVIFKSDNYILYCLTTLISNLIIFLVFELKFYKLTKGIKVNDKISGWKNIKIGIYILIGNFAVIFFYAIDRWFVKIFYNITDFAYYSFAISMLNIINTLIMAVSVIFYNYLSKNKNHEEIKKTKTYLIILSTFASLGYFALVFVINKILQKYVPSLSIIATSFASYPYLVVINSLYINLYKVNKDKRKYVMVMGFMCVVSVIYNLIAITLFNKIESIALATTISIITWYIYSTKHFEFLKSSKKENLYLLISTLTFLFCSHLNNWVIGFMSYLITLIVLCVLIYRTEFNEFLLIFKKIARG